MTPAYLIWSNQHGQWWRANERGYTAVIDEAGRYPRAYATRIVANATLDGQLVYPRVDPVTGRERQVVDEVMVLAPECIAEPAPEATP